MREQDAKQGFMDGLRANLAGAALGLMALYNPQDQTVYVVKSTVKTQNLDTLKTVLGHELVHVGQFRRHPELAEHWVRWSSQMTSSIAQLREGKGLADTRVVEMILEGQKLMSNLEGYAVLIEAMVLRRVYTCTERLPHLSMLQSWLARRIFGDDEASESAWAKIKKAQYVVGAEQYMQRAAQGNFGFDPTLGETGDT